MIIFQVGFVLNKFKLTRKDMMVKNLKRFKRTMEREQSKNEAQKCDFFPITFVLPVYLCFWLFELL